MHAKALQCTAIQRAGSAYNVSSPLLPPTPYTHTHSDCQNSERQVTEAAGHDFARAMGCLYVETSAKTNVAVQQAFEELVLKILETPALVSGALGSGGVKLSAPAPQSASTCSC